MLNQIQNEIVFFFVFSDTITEMEVTVIGQMTLFYEAELYFWPNTTQPD